MNVTAAMVSLCVFDVEEFLTVPPSVPEAAVSRMRERFCSLNVTLLEVEYNALAARIQQVMQLTFKVLGRVNTAVKLNLLCLTWIFKVAQRTTIFE
jgi:hypothetical protein